MCYFNGQRVSREEYIRLKDLEKQALDYEFLDQGVISGFSGTPVAVLVPTEDKSDFEIVQMEWGLIPPNIKHRGDVDKFKKGYKDSNGKWKTGYTTLNATSENLFTNKWGKKSMYADAARERRCLVLSTGFYEWRQLYRNHKKTGLPLKTPDRYPYHVNLLNKSYFFMAGIWQPWTDQETGEHVNTIAVTTTAANKLMEQVHNKEKKDAYDPERRSGLGVDDDRLE